MKKKENQTDELQSLSEQLRDAFIAYKEMA